MKRRHLSHFSKPASWAAAALVAAFLVGAGPAAADVVRLKNGQSLEGDVTEVDGQVKVRSAGGTIGFPADIVLRIERGDSIERQAAKRLQAMAPNDVDGRVELALELEQAGANTLAQRILESVLDLDPDHPAANRALGYVRCGEEWTTDEECHRLQGEVLYQGRWVGSEERTALEALDHARRTNERLRSEIQLESARLQADRASASMSYGGDYYGYPYDPYYFGGVPYYPFYGYGGGVLTGGRQGTLPQPSRPLRRRPPVRPPRSPRLGRRTPLRGRRTPRRRAAGASADAHA
jgi:hypothetical protein